MSTKSKMAYNIVPLDMTDLMRLRRFVEEYGSLGGLSYIERNGGPNGKTIKRIVKSKEKEVLVRQDTADKIKAVIETLKNDEYYGKSF